MIGSTKHQRLLAVLVALILGAGMVSTMAACREKKETLGDKIDEAAEEAKDEIDDHT